MDIKLTKPEEFFSEQLYKAVNDQKIILNPLVSSYLIELLCGFICVSNYEQKPLAFILKESIESDQPKTRLKYLGDFSLYTAGFFPNSLKRKLIDIDYYINMGRNAYAALAKESHVYQNLNSQFPMIIDIFNQISEEIQISSEKDLLNLYILWEKTESPRVKKKLAENGIFPQKKQPQ